MIGYANRHNGPTVVKATTNYVTHKIVWMITKSIK